MLLSEVESRTQGSRPRTQKNLRPKPRTALPRTDPLEGKDQEHRRKCSPKKKVFKNFFQAIHKNLTIQKILLSSSRGQGNFRGLEASRPRTWSSRLRPRTSKCALETKDVLKDSISGYYCVTMYSLSLWWSRIKKWMNEQNSAAKRLKIENAIHYHSLRFVFRYHSNSSFTVEVGNLRPAGQIRPAKKNLRALDLLANFENFEQIKFAWLQFRCSYDCCVLKAKCYFLFKSNVLLKFTSRKLLGKNLCYLPIHQLINKSLPIMLYCNINITGKDLFINWWIGKYTCFENFYRWWYLSFWSCYLTEYPWNWAKQLSKAWYWNLFWIELVNLL